MRTCACMRASLAWSMIAVVRVGETTGFAEKWGRKAVGEVEREQQEEVTALANAGRNR
jgi:hypothetical protein